MTDERLPTAMQAAADRIAAQLERKIWEWATMTAPEVLQEMYTAKIAPLLADLRTLQEDADPDPRPDALTGILANAVASQEGRCLTCNEHPALYCGPNCANRGR